MQTLNRNEFHVSDSQLAANIVERTVPQCTVTMQETHVGFEIIVTGDHVSSKAISALEQLMGLLVDDLEFSIEQEPTNGGIAYFVTTH